jgi:predicted Holliday junction resolvase-like endonuclease
MLEKFKQKWAEWLFAIALIILTTILTNYVTIKRETDINIKNQIDSKADKIYVDHQNIEIQKELKQGDDNMKQMLEQHAKAQSEMTISMDHKLDILLSRTK